jgi:hypothetical protein
MATRTTVTLACGHSYGHAGPPSEEERRHPATEVETNCRVCGTPQLIADVSFSASR